MATWSNPHIASPGSSSPASPNADSPGFLKSLRGRASSTWRGISNSLHRATRGVFDTPPRKDTDPGDREHSQAKTRSSNRRGSVFGLFHAPSQASPSPFDRAPSSAKTLRRGSSLFDKLNKLSTLRKKHKSSPSLGTLQHRASRRRSALSLEWRLRRTPSHPLSDLEDEGLPSRSFSIDRRSLVEFARLDVSPPEITNQIPSHRLEGLSLHRTSIETASRPGTGNRICSPPRRTGRDVFGQSQHIFWSTQSSAHSPSPQLFGPGSSNGSTFTESTLARALPTIGRRILAPQVDEVHDIFSNSHTSGATLRGEAFFCVDSDETRPRAPTPNMDAREGNANLTPLRISSQAKKSQWMTDETGNLHLVTCTDGGRPCSSQTCGTRPSTVSSAQRGNQAISWPDPGREHTPKAQKAAKEEIQAMLYGPQSSNGPDDVFYDHNSRAPVYVRKPERESELVTPNAAQKSLDALDELEHDLSSDYSFPGPLNPMPWSTSFPEPVQTFYELPSGRFGGPDPMSADSSDERLSGRTDEKSEQASIRKFSFELDSQERLDGLSGPLLSPVASGIALKDPKVQFEGNGKGFAVAETTHAKALLPKTVNHEAHNLKKSADTPTLSSLPPPPSPDELALAVGQSSDICGGTFGPTSMITPTSCAISTQPEEYFAPVPLPTHHRHKTMDSDVSDYSVIVDGKGKQTDETVGQTRIALTPSETPKTSPSGSKFSTSLGKAQLGLHHNTPIEVSPVSRLSSARNSPSKLPQLNSGTKRTTPTRIASPYVNTTPASRAGSLGCKQGSPTRIKPLGQSSEGKSGIPSPSARPGPYSKVPSLTQHRHTTCVDGSDQIEEDGPSNTDPILKRAERGSPLGKQTSRANMSSLRPAKSLGRM